MNRFKKLIRECDVCSGIFGTHNWRTHLAHHLFDEGRRELRHITEQAGIEILKPLVLANMTALLGYDLDDEF